MNPSEPRLLRVEAVADLPVLRATLQRLDLPATLDRHFPAPPHWKGPLAPGEVLAVWPLFLVSRGDHCLDPVEPRVARHQGALSALPGKAVLPTRVHDDRLADWLTRPHDGDAFAALQRDLNQHAARAYQLPTDLVRIDATTANSDADVLSEQGLLRFGHSKDDPDRPRFKIAAAVLDPLGLPLATAVVPGNTTDDPLYVPATQAVQQSLGAGGRTYVGDCKMAALATRAVVAAGGDFSLCPLSENLLSRAQRQALLQPVWEGTRALQPVWRPGPLGQPDELVAEGFAVDVALTATGEAQEVRWTGRRWPVRSRASVQAPEAALERRLAKAEAAPRDLPTRERGKKQLFHAERMRAAAAILARAGVDGLPRFTAEARLTARPVRAHRDRPARREAEGSFVVEVSRAEARLEARHREMGWQVYGTNAPALALAPVVGACRGQHRIEDDWSRLKGRSLGLTPAYLQDEGRLQGLVYLLSLALRVPTLVEWMARARLRQQRSRLQGIYPGQPGRKTDRPGAELLLGVLKTIGISVVEVNGRLPVGLQRRRQPLPQPPGGRPVFLSLPRLRPLDSSLAVAAGPPRPRLTGCLGLFPPVAGTAARGLVRDQASSRRTGVRSGCPWSLIPPSRPGAVDVSADEHDARFGPDSPSWCALLPGGATAGSRTWALCGGSARPPGVEEGESGLPGRLHDAGGLLNVRRDDVARSSDNGWKPRPPAKGLARKRAKIAPICESRGKHVMTQAAK